jgi:hypothetical protein
MSYSLTELLPFALRVDGLGSCVGSQRTECQTKQLSSFGAPLDDLRLYIANSLGSAKEKLYSYVQAVNVKDAKGLQTALVEDA